LSHDSPTLPGPLGLRPGCAVQIWRKGVLHHQGVVEEAMLQAKVRWIREDGLGTRKMIDLDDYVLRPS
jgi:hypothetical protein